MFTRRGIFLSLAGVALALPASKLLIGTVSASSNSQLAGAYPRPNQVALVQNAMIYADQRGVGRDVVLIHGANGSSRDFTFKFAAMLVDAGFRVTSFDRPGLGWSDDIGDIGNSPLIQAQFLIAAAKAFGVKKPIVLGQSYGGSVAMAWALIAPDYVSGLVSVSGATNVWPGELGLWYTLSASSFGEYVIAPMVESFATRSLAASILESTFAPDLVPDGFIDYVGVELSMRRETFIINANQIAALKSHLEIMEPNYAHLNVPLEIVFGSADTIVPVDVHGRKLVTQVPGANLVVLEGTGHMPHHSNPLEVLAAVNRVAERSA